MRISLANSPIAIAATSASRPTAATNSRDQGRRGKRACGAATAARPRRADDVVLIPTQNKSQPIAGLQGGYDAAFQYFSPKPAEDHGRRRRLGGLRSLCPPFLRRRQTYARRLGSLGPRRSHDADQAVQRVGGKEQGRGDNRLHHIAGR